MLNDFIKLAKVSKEYKTQAGVQRVLIDVDLVVTKGEFIALMGPSGSGKSTLMNILGCLDQPTSGNYLLDGKNVISLDANERAQLRNQTIGFVFQGFNLLPRATLEDNVSLPMIYARIKKEERIRRARFLLEQVGLSKKYSALPNQISGGEQQRVAIARALANNPMFILADEPTGNLDSTNSKLIMKIFEELNHNGITIFLVTHDEDIANYANRNIRLLDGSIINMSYSDGGKFRC